MRLTLIARLFEFNFVSPAMPQRNAWVSRSSLTPSRVLWLRVVRQSLTRCESSLWHCRILAAFFAVRRLPRPIFPPNPRPFFAQVQEEPAPSQRFVRPRSCFQHTAKSGFDNRFLIASAPCVPYPHKYSGLRLAIGHFQSPLKPLAALAVNAPENVRNRRPRGCAPRSGRGAQCPRRSRSCRCSSI